MIKDFKVYFEQIKKLDVQESTEHTLRPALDTLLNALAGKKVKVIHEPTRDKTGKGAPDFKFKTHDERILGYLENKQIGENLDQVLKSEQIAKYNRLSGNLILTNYLEWIWLKDGVILKRETLGYLSDVGNPKARLDSDKARWVEALIAAFLSTPPKGIGRAKGWPWRSAAMICGNFSRKNCSGKSGSISKANSSACSEFSRKTFFTSWTSRALPTLLPKCSAMACFWRA